eukprot:465096_1
MPFNPNTLCETETQCPNIPSEYFNQDIIVSDDSDNTELLVVLTSFFAGYTILFIAFVIFTLRRNKQSTSKYHKPVRLILITTTILIETLDVLTDIAQTNNVMNGVECGVTTCNKKDSVIGTLMIPCILIGIIATIISLYTFCKTTTFNMYDDEIIEKRYNKLNKISDSLKIFGENVPMMFMMLYWMFASGGGFLTMYSFVSITFAVSLLITGFNMYWLIIPLICGNCCDCCCTKDANEYAMETDTKNQMELATQPQPTTIIAPTTVQYMQPQPVIITQQQPLQSNEQLPHGWKRSVDPNGRLYYQNDYTKQTQWNKPSMINNQVQYAPTAPSHMAPRPMQAQPIQQQFSNSVVNDNATAQFDDPQHYYEKGDDLGCCARCCIWCGCILFSIPFWLMWFWSGAWGFGFTGLNQSFFQVLSIDDQCAFRNTGGERWEIDNIFVNVTGETYPLYIIASEGGDYPLMKTGVDISFTGKEQDEQNVACKYTVLPKTGECLKWIFSCESWDFDYVVDSFCADSCPA